MNRVIFLDTSVLLNVLDVPRKNGERATVLPRFKDLINQGATLVIPIAAIVEVGNHLAQLTGFERRDRAKKFADMLSRSLQGQLPWVVSGTTWDPAFLGELVEGHKDRPGMVDLCTEGVGTGDGSILLEVERYRQRSDLPSNLPVGLWSLDKGLQSHS